MGKSESGDRALRAFDKVARRKPLVVAADAGAMEIEWGKTAVWRIAETVRWSATDEIGSWLPRKGIEETARRKLKAGSCCWARRRAREHAERRKGFELDRVASCCSSG